jgi:hypothetical protein
VNIFNRVRGEREVWEANFTEQRVQHYRQIPDELNDRRRGISCLHKAGSDGFEIHKGERSNTMKTLAESVSSLATHSLSDCTVLEMGTGAVQQNS